MILQALTRYYEDLLSRGEIAAPGWAPAKISLALYINENGELTQIVPTMVEGTKGKKTVMQPQLMVLPAAVKRTVSIASNFLWDNSAYLLGHALPSHFSPNSKNQPCEITELTSRGRDPALRIKLVLLSYRIR